VDNGLPELKKREPASAEAKDDKPAQNPSPEGTAVDRKS
jgi:hypothetical protein